MCRFLVFLTTNHANYHEQTMKIKAICVTAAVKVYSVKLIVYRQLNELIDESKEKAGRFISPTFSILGRYAQNLTKS